jgi:hypothetical protein
MKADTYLCPGCDQEVVVGTRGCPHCQAPRKRRKRSKAAASGATRSWAQDKSADGLGLPDDDFDYDDFVAREFGLKPHRRIGIQWYWWVTAVVLLVMIVLGGFRILGW